MVGLGGGEFGDEIGGRVDSYGKIRVVAAADSPISFLSILNGFEFVEPTRADVARGFVANEPDEKVRLPVHEGVVVASLVGGCDPSASLPFRVEIFSGGAALVWIGNGEMHVVVPFVANGSAVDLLFAAWAGGFEGALEGFERAILGDDRLH